MRRIVYLWLAGVFFALATLGAILPVLPTTPFLLLTSYFLVRSSPSLHQRLLRSRLFGGLLRDWHEKHGVRLHVKVSAVGAMIIAVAFSILFAKLTALLLAVLVIAAAVGLIVILRIPTIRP
jgi:uncharacterized protein